MRALGKRLTHEAGERNEADRELETSLKDLTRSTERRSAELKDEQDEAAREIRKALLDRSNTLREELRQKAEELFAAIERESADLRNRKTDRASLAAMLNEVAMRLSAESDGPDA